MLSIRTQDRMALVPYNGKIDIFNHKDDWYISIIVIKEFELLGTYKSKERALEVLDEIEAYSGSTRHVYQMPK